MRKTGVFICGCGQTISNTINPKTITDYALTLEGVKCAESLDFFCSKDGYDLLRKRIFGYELERVVIGGCDPQRYESAFKRTLLSARLNPNYLKIVDIKSECIPSQNGKVQDKVKTLIEEAVLKARSTEFIKKKVVSRDVLVIGAGITGMQAALDLADAGLKVYLVESDPAIGGNMAKVVKTFPTDDCAMCTIAPKMNDTLAHQNITLFTYAKVRELKGDLGNFEVDILSKPRYVDEVKCVGCGACWEKCPGKARDEYNSGLGKRPAIYIPFSNALPKVPVIDEQSCLYMTKGKPKGKDICKICVKQCPAEAIDFDQKEKITKLQVGAIIVATGYKEYDPTPMQNLGFGRYPNIITQLQMARMIDPNGPTDGKVIRPSDNEIPKKIVMIQCVGSRDDKPTGYPYCSRVCCMFSIKHANLIKRAIIEDAQITICYMDIRAFGKGYEEYYSRAQGLGIKLIRGRPAEIRESQNKSLKIRLENTLTQQVNEIEADLVVLAAATEPAEGIQELARVLDIELDKNGFIKEPKPKLEPTSTSKEGIFSCGSAQAPKDIPDGVAQASGAAARIEETLLGEKYEILSSKL